MTFGIAFPTPRTAFAAFLLTTTAASAASGPPPPLGPPAASADAGSFPLTIIRGMLEEAGERIIEENNASSPHKLRWASNARPTECGYDCFGPPFMSATRHEDRPNARIVEAFGSLVFDLDVDNFPFDRRIVTSFTMRASCRGWATAGTGNILISVDTEPPFVDDDHGSIEELLNLVLLPTGIISRYVDEQVQAALGPGGSIGQELPATCATLGLFETGAPAHDTVIWDPPLPPDPFGRLTLANELATVRFESLTRRDVPTSIDPSQDVTFELYVNGEHHGVPKQGSLTLAPSETHLLDDLTVTLPADDLDALQIIVADNLGGAAFEHFERASGFPNGRRVLRTHRSELLPVGEPLPGIGGSNKPTRRDVQEFQLNYTVMVRPRAVVQPTPSGNGRGPRTAPLGPIQSGFAPR